MRRRSRAGLSWLFVIGTSTSMIAQDLESIGRDKPLSISGGLSLNQIFYAAHGVHARRDPYSYFASGNTNISIYGWNIPLSFNISNHKTSFSQPFNQYAVHPTWKWITAHAGYTSMTFSPYTVNGHIFCGGGIDLEPEGKWKVSAFYGRLLRATETGTSGDLPPTYERTGYGFKVSRGEVSNGLQLIMFRAADDEHSIHPPPDSLNVTPQENLVVSVAAGKRILRHFVLKAEAATSALTKNTRAGKTRHAHPLARSAFLFQPRLSSAYYEAFRTSLDYQLDSWLLGVAYERIDPGYQTLGAYYFNSDLENITANASAGFGEGKLNVAVSTGVQRDNVDGSKLSAMRRMVGSLNMNYIPSQRINVSATWSSFQTHTNIRPQFETINQLTPYDNLDTLNFTQISRNASLSGMLTLGNSETIRKSVQLNVGWQKASDQQGDSRAYTGTSFYNLNAGYSITRTAQNMSVSVMWNTTLNDAPFLRMRTFGPNASVNKFFFHRKLRTTLSSSYNRTYSNGTRMNTILNGRLNTTVSLQGKHNLSLSAVAARRSLAEGARGITEFTVTVAYNYSFSTRHKPAQN